MRRTHMIVFQDQNHRLRGQLEMINSYCARRVCNVSNCKKDSRALILQNRSCIVPLRWIGSLEQCFQECLIKCRKIPSDIRYMGDIRYQISDIRYLISDRREIFRIICGLSGFSCEASPLVSCLSSAVSSSYSIGIGGCVDIYLRMSLYKMILRNFQFVSKKQRSYA